MSSGSAPGGESIRRGIVLAQNEINSRGGLLGRPLELVVRDHHGNPERGIDNVLEFASMRDVLAVVGGIHTPVVLRELEVIHKHQMLFLVPWAAGTPITDNGYRPNFVFRVSVRDEYAGGFLVSVAERRGFRRLGLLLERTGWGRSNDRALRAAIQSRGLPEPTTAWFNWGDSDFDRHFKKLAEANATVILFVGNAQEGARMVASMANQPTEHRLPIISHWGITGGDFYSMASSDLQHLDLSFLQTHSFLDPARPASSQALFEAYKDLFPDCQSKRDIFSPVGTAHAYDLIMMLAAATEKAGNLDRSLIRDAFEQLESHQGVIRDYHRPFSADHHDALTKEDFRMARYGADGSIEPVVRTEGK